MEIFKQKVLSPTVYLKDFFLNIHSSKGFTKVYKSIPNWIQIPASLHVLFLCCHQGISVPRMAVEIVSYLVLVVHLSSSIPCQSSLFLFDQLHLLQPPKWKSRSSVLVTICHTLLQPSTTPHVSWPHLHIYHNNYMHTPSNAYL
jgi:hypothetical protein